MRHIITLIAIIFIGNLYGQKNKPNHQMNQWKNDTVPLGYKEIDTTVDILQSTKSPIGNKAMQITFQKNKKRDKTSDIVGVFPFRERPDSLIGVIKPNIDYNDTLLIIATLYEDNPQNPTAKSTLLITYNQHRVFNRYSAPMKYFSTFQPDSLKIDIIYLNATTEEKTVYIDCLNFTYQDFSADQNTNFNPIKVYPNPTAKGHVFVQYNPGIYDQIFVKNISTDEVVFSANQEQLNRPEIKIDLDKPLPGTYYIIFQNKSTIIRKEVEIQ